MNLLRTDKQSLKFLARAGVDHGDWRAIIIFPKQADYVNIADVMHLWCCLDGDSIPKIHGHIEGIGKSI